MERHTSTLYYVVNAINRVAWNYVCSNGTSESSMAGELDRGRKIEIDENKLPSEPA